MSDNVLRLGKAICRPATKLMEMHQQRKIEVEEGLRRTRPPPRAMKGRKRALTWQGANGIQAQEDSSLLAKLPLELRQMIWIECVGNMTVHLKIWDRRLRGAFCRCAEAPWCKHLRHYYTPDLEYNPLAVLLTCRQVYSEAVDFLYSHNVFKVVNPDCLAYLPQLMLPQHIDNIHYICFEWYLHHAPGIIVRSAKRSGGYDWTWALVWENLASMQRLEYLWINLNIQSGREREWIERQSVVFEPVKALRRLKHFYLVVPFAKELKQETLTALTCQTSLPGER